MPKIYLIDVTNRDGVQTAKLGLSKLEKTLINIYLDDMGVFQSEFGFPTTRHETNYLQANLELAEMGVLKHTRLGGWIRAVAEDVETTFERVPNIKHLNLSISTSDQMINGKFQGRKTRDDVIREMTAATYSSRGTTATTWSFPRPAVTRILPGNRFPSARIRLWMRSRQTARSSLGIRASGTASSRSRWSSSSSTCRRSTSAS